jgi:hypothetical protein
MAPDQRGDDTGEIEDGYSFPGGGGWEGLRVGVHGGRMGVRGGFCVGRGVGGKGLLRGWVVASSEIASSAKN